MKIREHLTYANVAATLALVGVVTGSGAYAAGLIDSGDVQNNALRSADLKNRAAVKGHDVKRDGLTDKEIRERSLDAAEFAPLVGDQGSCDPVDSSFVTCAQATLTLRSPGRLLVVATGDFFGATAVDASLDCRVAIDGVNESGGSLPGDLVDATDLSATDGFARTRVTDRLARGSHDAALRCSEPSGDDGRLASASIAVLGISG